MSKTYIPTNLRQIVFERAQGCCEYCLIPEMLVLATHQIDHVIAEKHDGATVLENLALSCSLCNQAKGSDIAILLAGFAPYLTDQINADIIYRGEL